MKTYGGVEVLFSPWHYMMVVSSQLHSPTTLTPGERAPVPTHWIGGWAEHTRQWILKKLLGAAIPEKMWTPEESFSDNLAQRCENALKNVQASMEEVVE
jgi:hypothetical protein